MIARALPSTRLARRRSGSRVLLVAIGIAALGNVALVAALAKLSTIAPEPVPPPLAALPLSRVDAPPPPPPPRAVERDEEPVEADVPGEVAVPTIPLPSLDLAAAGAADALALPALPPGDALAELPLAIPAFAIPEAAVGGAELALAAGPPAFDEPPRLRMTLDLERFYPHQAKVRGVTGTTRLRLAVAADGAVTACEILASEPAGVFEDAAQSLARTLRYEPATRGGRAVAGSTVTTIDWKLRSRR